MKSLSSRIGTRSSKARLGGTVSHYRAKQIIYSQGTPAFTVFYIEKGGVCLTTRAKHKSAAVTTILGAGDFFGALCLVGLPLHMSTAVALTVSSIRVIKKESMIRMLQKKKVSNPFVSYLLSCIGDYQDRVAELLTASAEQRLAGVLLRLDSLAEGSSAAAALTVSHQVLSEMVGTTRSRINFFMNRFRKLGFISYNGGLEVHNSLRTVLRSR